jgi:hypothetical protein
MENSTNCPFKIVTEWLLISQKPSWLPCSAAYLNSGDAPARVLSVPARFLHYTRFPAWFVYEADMITTAIFHRFPIVLIPPAVTAA